MIVKVFYKDYPFRNASAFHHVANVASPECFKVEAALDRAWERTQNIEGSWSMGPVYADGERNRDYSDAIEVVLPLEKHLGREMGHRSSMVGDVYEIDAPGRAEHGCRYEVAGSGFKWLEPA